MSNYLWLVFAAGTILCWGAYGSAMHTGTVELKSPWKAILLVGVAYFVLAVIVPAVLIQTSGSGWSFTGRGAIWALTAGALGAVGAMCVSGAMKNGGQALYVMPLIFGCAPLVNVIVSSIRHRPAAAPSPFFWAGIVVLASGAGMVLYFQPRH